MSNTTNLVRAPERPTLGSLSVAFRLYRRSAGFSLIEVMVAVVVVAIGLLGIAAVQLKTLSTSSESSGLSISTIQANDFGERLWAAACVLAQNADQRPAIATRIRNQWLTDHNLALVTSFTCVPPTCCPQPICFVNRAGIVSGPITYAEQPGADHPYYAYQVRWTEKSESGERLLFYVSLPPDSLFEDPKECP